jgi:hypothetical protein
MFGKNSRNIHQLTVNGPQPAAPFPSIGTGGDHRQTSVNQNALLGGFDVSVPVPIFRPFHFQKAISPGVVPGSFYCEGAVARCNW